MEVLIGGAAVIAAAVMSALFYRKGVKDGMGWKKAEAGVQEDGAEVSNELMRKYELIMSYDPYGATERPGAWSGYGERV
jgi:hypothetical protein